MAVALLLSLLLVLPAHVAGQEPRSTVLRVDVTGAIGVAASEHIAQAIARAEQEKAQLLLIRLDTPGGLVTSTRDIRVRSCGRVVAPSAGPRRTADGATS